MPSYVARPHVLADEFVPGYLGDSFGLFPFVHGDPLANQFDGPFLLAFRHYAPQLLLVNTLPNQANPLPTNDTPASDIPQRFQCPAMLGDGGVGNRKVRYRSARIPSPPSRGGALRALHSSLEHAREVRGGP